MSRRPISTTRPESAIVTDGTAASLKILPLPADALVQIEVWGDAAAVSARLAAAMTIRLPEPCRSVSAGDRRILFWEPSTWLVRAPLAQGGEALSLLIAALGAEGAATDISGAFRRIRMIGSAWRSLLMIGGVFDAESPHFSPGCCAGTVLHHLPLRYDVIADDVVDAYVAPSYAPDLLHHWYAAAL
jgi:heterotetrameric sarcosine oxidase gamma subunit